MRTPERTNRKKQRVSLLGVIANGSTGDARRLLKKYNEPDAVNHKDLEMKLSKLYAKTDDKIQLEKEIAEIHPHKEFILHNLRPVKPTPEPEITIQEVEAKTKEMASTGCPCGNPNCRNNQVSNACGCSSFSGSSCACGSCSSGIDGSVGTKPSSTEASNNGLMIVSVLGIITIFALSLRR
jgi:hypothetical protein